MRRHTDRSTRSRRELLCATGGLLALTAGCLSDEQPLEAGGDDDTQYETRSLHYPDVPVDPDVAVHTTRDAVEDWLSDRGRDRDEDLTEFVAETDFDRAVLVSLEADGPNPCHELTLEEVSVEAESIEIAAQVSDESDDEVCIDQETGLATLVRTTGIETQSVTLSATIVDRDGIEHDFELGS